MTWNASIFSEIQEKYCGTITLGDKGKWKVYGVGKVGNYTSYYVGEV